MYIDRGISKPVKPREVAILIGYVVAFVCIVLANYFYQDALFEVNLEYIPEWQSSLSASSIKFFEMITLLGYGAVGVFFFFIFYIFSTRERAFYLLSVHTTESLFNQLTKMMYRSPRPYFY